MLSATDVSTRFAKLYDFIDRSIITVTHALMIHSGSILAYTLYIALKIHFTVGHNVITHILQLVEISSPCVMSGEFRGSTVLLHAADAT